MPFGRRRRSFGRDRGFYPPPSVPRPVRDGLRAKSKRGAIGGTWWSRRFIEVLEDFHEGPRLVRGRAYARRGQVIDMDVAAGEVRAHVQGSRARPYNVSIGVTILDDADWARVEEAMASQAVFLARLLAGEMPPEIEDAFAATGLSLFPAAAGDLDTDCSCPDWENPCKHIAAVYYLLAEAFDQDPFLILAWRGRPRERLLADLRDLRGAAVGVPAPGGVDESDTGLAARLEKLIGATGSDGVDGEVANRFWQAGGDLAPVNVRPSVAAIPDAILRDLGPSGLSAGGRPLEDLLAPAYRAIAAAAVRIAGGEEPDEATLGSNPPGPTRPRSTDARPRARRPPRKPERGPSSDRLERLIEEATVDCYNESEARTGLFEMIHEHLHLPFATTVLGVAVTVVAIDITDDDRIVAVCRRGHDVLRVSLLELPMPDPRPNGAEWVDAYRHWAR